MLAKEIKDKYVRKEMHGQVGVIAIRGTWWHVHDDEIVPDNADVAIHMRYPEDGHE